MSQITAENSKSQIQFQLLSQFTSLKVKIADLLTLSFPERFISDKSHYTGIDTAKSEGGKIRIANFIESVKKNKQMSLTMIYMDLNNFKRINDHLGENVGDECIKLFNHTVAIVLEGIVGTNTNSEINITENNLLLTRLGGDETVILLALQRSELANKIGENLREFVDISFQAKSKKSDSEMIFEIKPSVIVSSPVTNAELQSLDPTSVLNNLQDDCDKKKGKVKVEELKSNLKKNEEYFSVKDIRCMLSYLESIRSSENSTIPILKHHLDIIYRHYYDIVTKLPFNGEVRFSNYKDLLSKSLFVLRSPNFVNDLNLLVNDNLISKKDYKELLQEYFGLKYVRLILMYKIAGYLGDQKYIEKFNLQFPHLK